eukprot:UN32412
MFKENIATDLKIECGEKTFSCHKAMLGVHSTVFKSMFENDFVEKTTRTLEIKDFKPDIVLALLQYIYSGKVNNNDIDFVSLVLIAEKYNITPLAKHCAYFLVHNLTIDNSCECALILKRF